MSAIEIAARIAEVLIGVPVGLFIGLRLYPRFVRWAYPPEEEE